MAAFKFVKHHDGKVLILIPRVASESMRYALGWTRESGQSWNEVWKPHMRDLPVAYFVRDPIDRLVSQYHFFNDFGMKKITGLKRPCEFDKFVRVVSRTYPNAKFDRHFWSQTEYLTHDKEFIKADFLGRFENLEEDWDKFREWSGWDVPDLEHRHKSDRNELYTFETLALAQKRFADDLNRFGYGD